MRHRCIAEFVDLKTGERVQPGSLVSFDEPERAERLVQAGCIVPLREKQPTPAKKQAAREPHPPEPSAQLTADQEPNTDEVQSTTDDGAQAATGEAQQGVNGGEDGNQMGA